MTLKVKTFKIYGLYLKVPYSSFLQHLFSTDSVPPKKTLVDMTTGRIGVGLSATLMCLDNLISMDFTVSLELAKYFHAPFIKYCCKLHVKHFSLTQIHHVSAPFKKLKRSLIFVIRCTNLLPSFVHYLTPTSCTPMKWLDSMGKWFHKLLKPDTHFKMITW